MAGGTHDFSGPTGAQFDTGNTQHNHFPPPLPPDALTPIPADAARGGLSNIPGELFVGRTAELTLLDRAFEQGGEVVVHAVHDLGGIGKTALAAHWASGRGEALRWRITADTPTNLQAGLAELARALKPVLALLRARTWTGPGPYRRRGRWLR